jgi:hypothetical protein
MVLSPSDVKNNEWNDWFPPFVLEYCCNVWSPIGLGLIDKLEKVQRNFTKRLNGLKDFTCPDRLKFLKLDSLEVRRLRADQTLYYKIFNGLIDLQFSDFFDVANNSITRGHSYKIHTKRVANDIDRANFSKRVVNIWNSLPNNIVSSTSLGQFKLKLSEFDVTPFTKRYY